MKAILMSIRPQHVVNILNGKKTIEIRKKFPKDYVGWVYIYCTKDRNNMLTKNASRNGYVTVMECIYPKHHLSHYRLNGKVVARFWCGKVEEIKKFPLSFEDYNLHRTSTLDFDDFEKASCLSQQELDRYLEYKNGYAIHITKVEPFDKPKELFDFKVLNNKYECDMCPFYIKDGIDDCLYSHHPKCLIPLTKAPQSWFYVEI